MKMKKTSVITLTAALLTAAVLLMSALPVSAKSASRLLGDADFDGAVSVLDATRIQKTLAKLGVMDDDDRKAADIDADTYMTILDATFIQRWLANITIPYPVGKPMASFEPTEPTDEAKPTEPVKPTESVKPTEPSPQTDIDSYEPSDYEKEVVRLTNAIRAEYGLSELKLNNRLCYVAHLKAQDMHDQNYFDHTSPIYGTPFEMMERFGISYLSAGENIAAGQRTPEAVVNGWMNSAGHRANILTAKFEEIGVGCYEGTKGYRVYWSQMFLTGEAVEERVLPVEDPAHPYTIDTYEPNAYEKEVVRLVNVIRRENQLSALEIDSRLSFVAYRKSQDMFEKSYVAHNSPTYGTPFEMMKSFGFTYMTAGENIAAGYRSPEDVVDAWMNSEGHRANILNPSFRRIGVGCFEGDDLYRFYWTQMFIG